MVDLSRAIPFKEPLKFGFIQDVEIFKRTLLALMPCRLADVSGYNGIISIDSPQAGHQFGSDLPVGPGTYDCSVFQIHVHRNKVQGEDSKILRWGKNVSLLKAL